MMPMPPSYQVRPMIPAVAPGTLVVRGRHHLFDQIARDVPEFGDLELLTRLLRLRKPKAVDLNLCRLVEE